MATKYHRSNPYMGILVLISMVTLTKVSSDRCPFDETQVFPSPPEFPDFMSVFGETILRIGLTNIPPLTDGLRTCPQSVNWSEFNSRLCGNDPFDLDAFCSRSPSAEPMTVGPLTTMQTVVARSPSIETTKTPSDLSDNITSSTVNLTTIYPGLNHPNDTDPTSSHISGYTYSDDQSSKDSEYEYKATTDSKDPVLPSDVYAINGSKGVAAALYQGGGASIAIGVGCGMTLLCFLVIVVIIVLSHQTRERGCMRLMNPLFKVFQRQRSDVRPLTWSLSNQSSTPLEEIRPNHEILASINEAQLRSEQTRFRNE